MPRSNCAAAFDPCRNPIRRRRHHDPDWTFMSVALFTWAGRPGCRRDFTVCIGGVSTHRARRSPDAALSIGLMVLMFGVVPMAAGVLLVWAGLKARPKIERCLTIISTEQNKPSWPGASLALVILGLVSACRPGFCTAIAIGVYPLACWGSSMSEAIPMVMGGARILGRVESTPRLKQCPICSAQSPAAWTPSAVLFTIWSAIVGMFGFWIAGTRCRSRSWKRATFGTVRRC